MSWRESRRRTLAWVRRARRDLVALLGGKCAECGTTRRLEFDHPHGRDYDPARLSRWSRIARYRRDAAAGNLRVLCRSHNASRKSWEGAWALRKSGYRG